MTDLKSVLPCETPLAEGGKLSRRGPVRTILVRLRTGRGPRWSRRAGLHRWLVGRRGIRGDRSLIHPSGVPYLWAVAIAGIIGFIGNELVAQYRIRVGRQIGSGALVADGLHARADGFTSLAVVVGAAGVAVGFPAADTIVGLIIAVLILVVLKDAARDVLMRILDGVDPVIREESEAALADVPGVEGVGEVRVRWIGHRLHAEAEITVDESLTIAEAHDIAERARHALLHEVPHLASAIIHADPCAHGGGDPHAELAHHATKPEQRGTELASNPTGLAR